ncbi:MAG: CDP-diacylglycerol--glycerol-3-phosphate 3-phosphatidyltransferase [Verrucomicrobiales bacterium]|nr:CDP-diacylglycerol--glycerol-3-phosphate 3-phosphatidyltransferase [Verrucomicrobiales bacterium]
MELNPTPGARRELTSRNQPWAQKLARRVADTGITPNTISLFSVFFSAGAAYLLGWLSISRDWSGGSAALCYLIAAVCIQLRLLCNLLDGMVAVECGKKSATGGIFNEAPDRLADVMLLVAAGRLAGDFPGPHLPPGWIAAVLAMGTAYIRALGGTLTGTQNFMGPMAKQHRMFWLTLACLVSAAVVVKVGPAGPQVLWVWVAAFSWILLGSVVTCARRLKEIARLMKSQAAAAGVPVPPSS